MKQDEQQPQEPDSTRPDANYVAVARWDGASWAVSVPNYGGQGRATTVAATLAEVVPNAGVVLGALADCRPESLLSRIDMEVHVDPEIAARFRTARDPWEAAEVLRSAGLSGDDIRDLVLSNVFPAIAPGADSGDPVIGIARAGDDHQ